jgi:hypothetical protein
MTALSPTAKLAAGALAAAGLVGVLFVVLRGSDDPRGATTIAADAEAVPPPEPVLSERVELVPPPRVVAQSGSWSEATTVLWPCRVELELLQADYLPTMDAVPPVGTGQSARLSGRIAGPREGGVRAEVRFVAGPNRGRVLLCDATGAFGAADLYPGLAVVEVRGPDIAGAKREVRLRQGKETLLNIGFGLTVPVQGRVVNRHGEPVAGARVELDGRETFSGPEGGFFFGSVAGGDCLVLVEHPDFAWLLYTYPVAAGRERQARELVLTLDDPASISISTPSPAGGPGPTLAFLMPTGSGGGVQRGLQMPVQPTRFPWFRVNPIEVPPGSPVLVENLPRDVFKVAAFRAGAVAREEIVNPRSDRVHAVTIRLQAAPTLSGIVTWRDQPLPGVQVMLQAPDQVRANLGFLRQPSLTLESEVMPYFPPAMQSVRTDAEGRYRLTAWADVSAVRYLEARGPLGSWAGRLVRAGEERVDLELKSVELGDSTLVVEFPGRTQGLPLEVVVNGAPQDPYVLGPESDLVVDSLLSGRWRLHITWHGEPVLEHHEVDLSGEETVRAALPIGAVEGQDEDAWRRAGRAWPVD